MNQIANMKSSVCAQPSPAPAIFISTQGLQHIALSNSKKFKNIPKILFCFEELQKQKTSSDSMKRTSKYFISRSNTQSDIRD